MIFIPASACAHGPACNKAAQSGLRNVWVAAKTCFTDADTYSRVTLDGDTVAGCGRDVLVSIEPSVTMVDGSVSSDEIGTVSVAVKDEADVMAPIGLAAWSGLGENFCFYLVDDPATGTTFGTAVGTAPDQCFGKDAFTMATDDPWNY